MKERFVNGYRVIHVPEYENCYTKQNWNGWIFEHRYVMELHLKRKLDRKEYVHHIDGNKLNNSISNLQLMSINEHTKLHHPKEIKYCVDCGLELNSSRNTRCLLCSRINSRKVERPSKETLSQLLKLFSYTTIALNYNVSDNAVRKWAKLYGLI